MGLCTMLPCGLYSCSRLLSKSLIPAGVPVVPKIPFLGIERCGRCQPHGTVQLGGMHSLVIAVVAGNNGLLAKVLSNQKETMKQVLGRPIQDSRQQPCHAVVIARSAETIGSSEASCSFEVILTQPTFKLDTEALCQVGVLSTAC